MSAVENAPPVKRAPERRPLAAIAAARSDRRFRIGLACAFLAHVLLIVGTLASAPRRMGEEKGNPDGVSVVIVDVSEMMSRSSVPAEPEAPPSPPAEAPQPPTPPPQPKTPPPPKQKQEAQQEPAQNPTAPQLPSVFPLPDLPGETKAPPQKQAMQSAPAPTPPARKPAAPRFELPDVAINPGGSQAAATRPPGITRSGENDEFGRNVIRALARTMPRLVQVGGRVTVRIFLNEKGNISDVQIIKPSGDPYIDQNVVFSVKQASFPIPPDGATTADRTFLVTYIYR